MLKYSSAPARKTQPKKRRKTRPTIYKWLRERTSSIDYGMKWQGHPIHCNSNLEVLEAFNKRRWLSRMTNARFDAHFSGAETYYFTGNGRCRVPETLVMIDIDCHARGTLEAALAFAKYLKNNHYPNLYYEVSTNGQGVHCYIVVEKFDLYGEFINSLLKRLDYHLKALLSAQNFEVENVEVKGTCPVLTWGERRGELTNYRSGQLAKLPRESHRFEELRNTTRLSYHDLLKLPPVMRQSTPQKAERTPTPASSGSMEKTSPVGSIAGKHFREQELAQVKGHYLKVAQALMDAHSLSTTGRAIVTATDVAIFLMLLRFFTENMNTDRSLPYARFKGLWDALFEAGDIKRPFEPKRFAAIRNYLSSLGLLDWEDEHYRIGRSDHLGQHQGQACRWHAGDLLMQLLEWEKASEDEEQAGLNALVTREEGEREERAPLAGTGLQGTIASLSHSSEHQTIRPVLDDGSVSWRLNPDEIAPYITPFGWDPGLAA